MRNSYIVARYVELQIITIDRSCSHAVQHLHLLCSSTVIVDFLDKYQRVQ